MRETEAIWLSSISFASLWASSTGWTLVRKARPNAPSTSPPSFASRLRNMLIPPRRVVLSRGQTRRPPWLPYAHRLVGDDDHERGRDAAGDGAAGVIQSDVRGQGVAERDVCGDERGGTEAGAEEVDDEPPSAHHQRQRHGARRPGQGRGERRRGGEGLQRVGDGRRDRAVPARARERAVRGAEQERPSGERLAEDQPPEPGRG